MLPRHVPAAAGKLLQGVLQLFGQEVPMITIITSSRGTMQSIQEPSKVIQEEHIGTASQEDLCVLPMHILIG